MRLPEGMDYGPAPEAADVAYAWLDGYGRRFGCFIGGEFRQADEAFVVFNPSNGAEIAQVAQGSAEDVDRAVEAARGALAGWRALGGHGRARFLYALARQVQKHARLFAVLESLDNGKPIRETRDIDIPLVARHFYAHAGWAQLFESEFESHGYAGVGVAGQIIPWNFPLLMLAWKIAPALAMGNTVVLKPAEYTPLTALLFAEICQTVSLPPGVVNIVTGDGSTGAAIVEHPDVNKVAFTGSTEVGRILRERTAGTGKKFSLELGGKSAFVVFEDADLDGAVEGVVDAIWFNQGQVCCAGSRLLVQESVAERFLAKLRGRMETLRVGNPLDKAVDIGAIVAPVQLKRIEELVGVGVQEGAELFQPTGSCPRDGWFYPPTLLSNVSPSSTVAQIEIFGPVLVAMTFRTPDEAVRLANNTVYGLAASVWSETIGQALDVAHRLVAGTVWVNCTNQFDAASEFGGYRESGFGREGGYDGLFEYLTRSPQPCKPWPSLSSPAELMFSEDGDTTHKQYIGGKQARPDSGYSVTLADRSGRTHEFARGNRKDIRNAVEAARKAQAGWAGASAHGRAQVLYYVAENLLGSRMNVVEALETFRGTMEPEAEFDLTIQRLYEFAAWADKFEGRVHEVPGRVLCYSRREPLGTLGVLCSDEHPLLGMVGPCAAALAMGNTVVALASEARPLAAVTLYRVLEASDVPGGVWNILTGPHGEMVPTLADHMDLDGFWCFEAGWRPEIERRSAANLKRTWAASDADFQAGDALRQATQIKNVWVPVGS